MKRCSSGPTHSASWNGEAALGSFRSSDRFSRMTAKRHLAVVRARKLALSNLNDRFVQERTLAETWAMTGVRTLLPDTGAARIGIRRHRRRRFRRNVLAA